jgi:hypothetical protein
VYAVTESGSGCSSFLECFHDTGRSVWCGLDLPNGEKRERTESAMQALSRVLSSKRVSRCINEAQGV